MPQDLPRGYSGLGADGARRANAPVVPPEPAPRDYGPPAQYRRRALLALAGAAVGIGLLVAGVREAVRRVPPDAEARARARGDSLRAARQGGGPGGRRDAGGGARGEDVPRLR